MKKILSFLIPSLLVSGLASAEVSSETAFVFNTFLFVFCGILVMFMALGFAMLEAGFVRKKNTSAILLKNIALYSIAWHHVLSGWLQLNVCRRIRLDRIARRSLL
jgi:Amt family ammonium transporter